LFCPTLINYSLIALSILLSGTNQINATITNNPNAGLGNQNEMMMAATYKTRDTLSLNLFPIA
jgi:hypothetical protein